MWKRKPCFVYRKLRFRDDEFESKWRLYKFPWLKPICFSECLKQFLELWNAFQPFRMTGKHFGKPLEMVRILFENPLWNVGEKNSPSLRSLSTCWRMRESTTCYNFCFFVVQKYYSAALFGTDLFIVVERSKDITHVKLLPSLVVKISDICECKRQ